MIKKWPSIQGQVSWPIDGLRPSFLAIYQITISTRVSRRNFRSSWRSGARAEIVPASEEQSVHKNGAARAPADTAQFFSRFTCAARAREYCAATAQVSRSRLGA